MDDSYKLELADLYLLLGGCLLYTYDADDEPMRVYLGGRSIIKKKFFKK